MVNRLSLPTAIRADFLTEPERMLFCAIIITTALQFAKLFMPRIQGWAAILSNAALAAVALFVVFRFELTWTALAIYLCIGLIAAGIHGTVTRTYGKID
jgi:hypothetical protein